MEPILGQRRKRAKKLTAQDLQDTDSSAESDGRLDAALTDPRKLPSAMIDTSDAIISVQVGSPVATVFHVHSTQLSCSSGFFQSKLKPEWMRGDKVIDLRPESPQVFKIYSSWLYTSAIHTAIPNDSSTKMKIAMYNQVHQDDSRQLVQAYTWGETLLDTKFQDAAMDAIICKLRGRSGYTFYGIGAEIINMIYEGTTAESPARLLLMDIYTIHANEAQIRRLKNEVPADFVHDIAIGFASRKSAQPLNLMQHSAAKYHHKKH